MFVGYIQNNEDKTEQIRQYQAVQAFAKEQGLKLDCLCADYTFTDIQEMILPQTEGIVIFNISALGDGLTQIKENLLFCRDHKLQIYSIEDGYHFNENNLTDDFFKGIDIAIDVDDFFKGIDIAIDVRSNLISQNVKKVLKKRKNEGVKLGRPLGALIKKRLEGKEEEIRKLLAQKVTKAEIARRFNVTRNTVFRFVKRNGLEENLNKEIRG